jgi:SHS2 domain-containing protein
MRRFKFVEHTADIAVNVIGDTLEELFTAAAEALTEIITDDFKPSHKVIYDLSVRAETQEELLVGFLNELNYLVEVKKLIFREATHVVISEKDKIFKLNAAVSLSELSPGQNLENEIKAITYHKMNIEHGDNIYSTMIVFDI